MTIVCVREREDGLTPGNKRRGDNSVRERDDGLTPGNKHRGDNSVRERER